MMTTVFGDLSGDDAPADGDDDDDDDDDGGGGFSYLHSPHEAVETGTISPSQSKEDTHYEDPSYVSPSSPQVQTTLPMPSSSDLSTGPSVTTLTQYVRKRQISSTSGLDSGDATSAPTSFSIETDPSHFEGKQGVIDLNIPFEPVSAVAQQVALVKIGTELLSGALSQKSVTIERQTLTQGHTVSSLSQPPPSFFSQQELVVQMGTQQEAPHFHLTSLG